MVKYRWGDEELPVIEVHSARKHDVLSEYLRQYVLIVGGHPYQRKSMVLTLIDGFAGGGLYQTSDGDLHPGSPLIFLRSTQEAALQLSSRKEFRLHAHYIFVEKSRRYLDFLKRTLHEQGYGKQIDESIFLQLGTFEQKIAGIIDHIERRGGTARRCIFLLDQYGYTDVSLSSLKRIFTRLPRAEVILTFAVDFLIDYLRDCEDQRKTLHDIGFTFDLNDLLESKRQRKWRQFIQLKLYEDLVGKSGARYFTNFFIKSNESHKSYWLLHLSMHPKARDEMQNLHWKVKNHFVHEGKPGLFMLGYDPKRDLEFTGQTGQIFTFSERDRKLNDETLLDEIPKTIPRDGLPLHEYFITHCNQSTATYEMMKEAVYSLYRAGEIEIFTKSGQRKKKGCSVGDKDVLHPRMQLRMDFGNKRMK